MQPYILYFHCVSLHAWQEMAENGGGGQPTVKARFNFKQNNEDELSFSKGDLIVVTRQEEGGWWEGTLNGKTGWFPSNYVREIKPCGELGRGRCPIDPLSGLCVRPVLASGFGVALERQQRSHMLFIRCRETSVSKGNSADQELLQCGKFFFKKMLSVDLTTDIVEWIQVQWEDL